MLTMSESHTATCALPFRFDAVKSVRQTISINHTGNGRSRPTVGWLGWRARVTNCVTGAHSRMRHPKSSEGDIG